MTSDQLEIFKKYFMMIKNKVKSITKNLDTITCVNALVVKDLTCSILVGKNKTKKAK